MWWKLKQKYKTILVQSISLITKHYQLFWMWLIKYLIGHSRKKIFIFCLIIFPINHCSTDIYYVEVVPSIKIQICCLIKQLDYTEIIISFTESIRNLPTDVILWFIWLWSAGEKMDGTNSSCPFIIINYIISKKYRASLTDICKLLSKWKFLLKILNLLIGSKPRQEQISSLIRNPYYTLYGFHQWN